MPLLSLQDEDFMVLLLSMLLQVAIFIAATSADVVVYPATVGIFQIFRRAFAVY